MKINLRTLIINICCIVLLFYPFNSTIIRKIYPSNSLVYIFAFLALLILLILGKVKKIKKYQMIILIVTILLGTFEVISNKYQYKTKMVIFTTYLFVPLVMSFNGDSITGFKKGIKLFAFENIAVTYFEAIFSNLYANSLLKFL